MCIGANYNHSGTFSVFYQFIVIKVRGGGQNQPLEHWQSKWIR